MLLIIIWYFFHNYFWPRPWPQPPEIGLGLVAMASASVSQLWPRPRGFGHVWHHWFMWNRPTSTKLPPGCAWRGILYPVHISTYTPSGDHFELVLWTYVL